MKQDIVKSLSLVDCQKYLTPRKASAHKGDFGHVVVVGGDYGMGGAPRLTAEASLRAGAGLVSIITRPEHAYAISGAYPEIMSRGFLDNELENCLPILERANVIVIGPGLGQQEWGKRLLQLTLESVDAFYRLKINPEDEIEKKYNRKRTLVVDADAINILSQQNFIREYLLPEKIRRGDWILTPHIAEAGRLLGISASGIQSDRIAAIKSLRQKFQGVIVLKGSGTLILGDSEEIYRCDLGNPGMATAGMGDILTGVVAGLVAQNLSPEIAAKLGVCAYAAAGDSAAYQYGQRGLNARDILEPLRKCLNPI